MGIFNQKPNFNPELIDHVKFYAGGFPAKYGCAMSSVLEVTNIRGNREKLEGKLNLSFISNNGYMTGPLSRKKGSWVFSMRADKWAGEFLKLSLFVCALFSSLTF